MNKKLLLSIGLTTALTSVQAQIVNDTWADGDRLNQDIANNSMAWYSSSGSSNVSVNIGSMTQNTGGAGRHIVGSFTAPGSPVSIADGEALQVRFTVSFNRGSALGTGNDFRMGVWNSQGARVDADNHSGTSSGNQNAAFTGYEGYMFSGGLDASRSISVRRKDGASDGILISSTSVYTTLGATASGTHTTINPNVDYEGALTLSRSGSELLISYSMDLGATNYASISRLDNASPYFAFDTIAFLVGSNVADGFTLKQVEVAVVPEPGLFGLISGLMGMGCVMIIRRRRAMTA